MMQAVGRIPRWIIEKDPSWEKLAPSNNDVLEWTKKGADLRAICDPVSIYCDIMVGERNEHFDLSDSISNFNSRSRRSTFASADIAKYLSSRYLNPRFDINRTRLFRFHKF
jgi:hypothetical protein